MIYNTAHSFHVIFSLRNKFWILPIWPIIIWIAHLWANDSRISPITCKKRDSNQHTSWSFDISSLHSLWGSVNNLCISGETSAGISFCISSLFAFSHTHLRINIRRHTKSCINESLMSSLLSINNQTKHLTLNAPISHVYKVCSRL